MCVCNESTMDAPPEGLDEVLDALAGLRHARLQREDAPLHGGDHDLSVGLVGWSFYFLLSCVLKKIKCMVNLSIHPSPSPPTRFAPARPHPLGELQHEGAQLQEVVAREAAAPDAGGHGGVPGCLLFMFSIPFIHLFIYSDVHIYVCIYIANSLLT